jgi:hypothetical protein
MRSYILWDVTPCSLKFNDVSEEPTAAVSRFELNAKMSNKQSSEDQGSTFIRDIGKYRLTSTRRHVQQQTTL